MGDPSDEAGSSFDADTQPAAVDVGSDDVGCVAAGTVIGGKYRVEAVIGRGGMGVVIAARHLALGRDVAIKLLNRSAAANSEAVERFLREGRAAARLESRHVVRVIDVGTTPGGTAHVVMERLEGTDLAALLREEGPLPIETAADYVLQACSGLAEAHERGIVHRDLKPSNLFLTEERGQPLVKILDFGVAKLLDAAEVDAALTATSGLLGSPAYMAPEQIRAARNVDTRADVWSLGVVLFELVTGSLPFAGSTPSAVLAAIAADRPIPLRTRRPDAPGALERLILRCLDKDPAKRPRDAAELGGALAQFSPRPADWTLASVTKTTGRRSRPPYAYALVGAAAVAALGAVIFVPRKLPPTLERAAPAVSSRIAAPIGALAIPHVTPAAPSESSPVPTASASVVPKRSAPRRAIPQKPRGDVDTATAERK